MNCLKNSICQTNFWGQLTPNDWLRASRRNCQVRANHLQKRRLKTQRTCKLSSCQPRSSSALQRQLLHLLPPPNRQPSLFSSKRTMHIYMRKIMYNLVSSRIISFYICKNRHGAVVATLRSLDSFHVEIQARMPLFVVIIAVVVSRSYYYFFLCICICVYIYLQLYATIITVYTNDHSIFRAIEDEWDRNVSFLKIFANTARDPNLERELSRAHIALLYVYCISTTNYTYPVIIATENVKSARYDIFFIVIYL